MKIVPFFCECRFLNKKDETKPKKDEQKPEKDESKPLFAVPVLFRFLKNGTKLFI
jgi:hypothetical protein